MAHLNYVDDLSKQLSRPDNHATTLTALIRYAAKGHDISAAAERIVRYCLFSASGTTPFVLSLSLDCLLASPSHAFWVDTLSVLLENLRRQSTYACLMSLHKLPSLPHAALQHLSLYAVAPLIHCLSRDASPALRAAAVPAVAAIALRERPLTSSAPDNLRLEPLSQAQLKICRSACERLLFALLQATFDTEDAVAVSTLTALTRFALGPQARPPSLLSSSHRAAATAVFDVLVPSAPRISDRLTKLCNSSSSESDSSHRLRNRREALKALSRLAAYALSTNARGSQTSSTPAEAEANEKAVQWATSWVDKTLMPALDDATLEIMTASSSALLLVCSYAISNPSPQKVATWGSRAVTRITRFLHDHEKTVSITIMNGLVRDGTSGLAALSKSDHINSKFVTSNAIGLLSFATKCPGKDSRLDALSLIAATVVEYDLSSRDTGVGLSLKALIASDAWKSAIQSEENDFLIPSEIVCCFSQALLEASKKIYACADGNLRLSLTHTWAVMLSHLMISTSRCLSWSFSPVSSYAKDMYLKTFDALGQYSSFLVGTQGIGMEEYERLQEVLVKTTLEQKDVGTRAALLTCMTRYWLKSGIKAEANAGHMLKAFWKHAQEHYRDEEIFLDELKKGVLWSDAKQGTQTRAQRATEGGYISFTTQITKRTRAVLDTVGTSVSTAIENTLFGSIALATAAAEGSTLTTDYIYCGLSALLALIGHNPPLAENAISRLNQYISIMEEAESSDFIALEAVRNTIAALEMYLDDFFPKTVAVRILPGSSSRHAQTQQQRNDPLAWMHDITESCVFATSRLQDAQSDATTVSTEESILHVASSIKPRLQAFSTSTLERSKRDNRDNLEGNQQTLSGASDPFGVIANHLMDTVKGLALLKVEVINRSKFRATNAVLTFSAAGALMPLSDSASFYALGTLSPGMSSTQQITLSVRRNQGFAGKVFISISSSPELNSEGRAEEQSCIPYYIPSSDVLLLRYPPNNAGVDVFRRRWDLMRNALSFHVLVKKNQTVDNFVDTLERRSHCLRQVGRIRDYSHVCALVADSSRGDYIAVAGLAPEARGYAGSGPCMLYVTIRSNSANYNEAFREECREWLQPNFKVIFPDDDLSEEDKSLALRPQDAYFITSSGEQSPYQRWRKAHALRMTY